MERETNNPLRALLTYTFAILILGAVIDIAILIN